MDEYEFEQLVANVWEQRGWETTVTTGSSDRGIDVIAEKSGPFSQKHLIQAKRYSAGNKIGSPDIQQYSSLRQQESDVDAVVVVTTSSFTAQAQQTADDLNVKLVDGNDLCEMILELDSQDFLSDYFESKTSTSTSKSSNSLSDKNSSFSTSNKSSVSASKNSNTNSTKKSSSTTENKANGVSYNVDPKSGVKFAQLRDNGKEHKYKDDDDESYPSGGECPTCDDYLYKYESDNSGFKIKFNAILGISKTKSYEKVAGCKKCGSLWILKSGILRSKWKKIVGGNIPSENVKEENNDYRGIQ
ncbi:restriction endonuclease [Halovenus salina]|uniref:Restriction endonuclease n=1 Tax=Halovenus salina TaxID=1510225 RepID=A0ABD5W4M3_9EURY|nr:restriction endonuclease [Halovenus salina]